jgi:hypothetical protein
MTILKSAILALAVALSSVSAFAQTPPCVTMQSLAQPDQTSPDANVPGTWTLHVPSTVTTGTMCFTPAAAPPTGYVVSNEKATGCAGSSPSANTCTSASYNVVSGHSYIINPTGCGSGCGTAITGTVSGITDSASLLGSCAVATGARVTASSPMKTEIWKCSATASGATAIKATWTAAVNWSSIDIVDVAQLLTDDGKGNAVPASGMTATGTALTVSTNGATTKANELIVAAFYCNIQGNSTISTGYTAIGGNGIAYSGTNSAGVNGFNATCPGNTGGNPFAVAIAAFR